MKLILISSMILSLLHSILLWEKTKGISVVIFCMVMLGLLINILKKNHKIKNKEGFILIIPIVLLAATYFIFYNLLFRLLNFFAILLLILIMCIWVTKENIALPRFISKLLELFFMPIKYFGTVANAIRSTFISKEKKEASKTKKVIVSLFVALPIVFIVLALLASADSVFGNLFQGFQTWLNNLFVMDSFSKLFGRIIIFVFLLFYFAAFAYHLVEEDAKLQKASEKQKTKKWKMDNFTMNLIFALLNIIYVIFAGIQFLYLFTKAGVGEEFDYASYARQGFFQLMFVSFINFAMIGLAQRNTQSSYLKTMQVATIIFTGIILVSAFMRMNLYEIEFGYTYLRLFVYFILLTECILLIPTLLYVLKQNINMLKAVILVGTTMYVILNFINIDAIIAKKNIERYLQNPEKEIDLYYLQSATGIDAIPQITQLLKVEDEQVRISANRYLYYARKQINAQQRDWLEWNLSESKAKAALEDAPIEEPQWAY